MQPTTEARAERLLAALAGVVSARAVADEFGRLSEIHVLASPDLHPKQIVRNVESALSAGLGVIVDRRIISVAQLRQSAAEPYMAKQKQLARDQDKRDERLVYVQYDSQSTSALDTTHGKTFVLVSARSVSGRTAHVLTGIAALQRSPEEAAILACLQATNRLAAL
jgi:hypothetical protein